MADSITENYDLVKPEVGASNNTWGGKTNANWDSIDSLLKSLDAVSAAAKNTLALADKIGVFDSDAEFAVKITTLTSLKAALLASVSLANNIFEIVDNADATKKVGFQLSGVTAGQKRVLTVPDLSGTLALLAGAQTFTDKTFTQPIIILKQGAAELPTAEGDIRWDTDDNYLAIGDGAATKVLLPVPAGLAAGDLLVAGANGKSLTRVAKSTRGKVLSMDAAAALPEWTDRGVLMPAQSTETGTAFDFTDIPPWASQIAVLLNNVSVNGNDPFLIQIGDAGGIETTGYASSSTYGTGDGSSASGFIVRHDGAGSFASGIVYLEHMGNGVWVESHTIYVSNSERHGGGIKQLSEALDKVRLTRTGTNTFDNGQVAVRYR